MLMKELHTQSRLFTGLHKADFSILPLQLSQLCPERAPRLLDERVMLLLTLQYPACLVQWTRGNNSD